MTEDWLIRAETYCLRCGGRCCDDAHPPISEYGYRGLTAAGVPADAFELDGYRRLKTRPDGTCVQWIDGKCSIHGIKPETCRAGPFTFDVKEDVIAIYLKYESICPIVRLLKDTPAAYEQQFERAVKSITHLVAHLSEEELGAICRIGEPETEKVAEIPRHYDP